MRIPPSPDRPALDKLLKKAARHKMTPAERWDQRISFAYGQLMDCRPNVSRQDIIDAATHMYGPRPKDTAP